MKAIQATLLEDFKKNRNDTGFPARAAKAIAEFKGRGIENKKDPDRLNVRGAQLTILKNACIASLEKTQVNEHYSDDMFAVENTYNSEEDIKIADIFDDMKPVERYEQQRKWRKMNPGGIESALARVRVIPEMLEQIKLNSSDAREANDNTEARMREQKEIKVDVDAMLAVVMPDLHSTIIPKLALALLLATGRRTVEIFKTAEFKRIDKYRVSFSGQAQSFDDTPYEIDLLAEADLVITALASLRALAPTANMTKAVVNTTYGKMMSREVDKLSKQLGFADDTNLTPHTLRAIYGNACMTLYKPKKMKGTRYLAELFGHVKSASTNHYTYVDAEITMPFVETKTETKDIPEGKEEKTENNDGLFGLTSTGHVPHQRKVEQIAGMMKDRKVKMTVTSILAATKGSKPLIKDVMKWGNNAAIINAYNQSF